MLSMLAYFELLTQPEGSHRRRCCVRRIILTRTLAFMGCNGRQPLQGCCGSNIRRLHRQDRRKSTLECRRAKRAFFSANQPKTNGAEIGLVFEKRQVESNKNILVIAATNFPWDLDSAVLRRFTK
jgi:hypothetical protein